MAIAFSALFSAMVPVSFGGCLLSWVTADSSRAFFRSSACSFSFCSSFFTRSCRFGSGVMSFTARDGRSFESKSAFFSAGM